MKQLMSIAILEVGGPPENLASRYPSYGIMIEDALKGVSSDLSFSTIRIWKGQPLPEATCFSGYVVTASAIGVNDDVPWVKPLLDFIRTALGQERPCVGICFGHQAIAQAVGGSVSRTAQGWGIGRHTYHIINRQDCMINTQSTISLGASHQDQVTQQPPGSVLLAKSNFTPIAALFYEKFKAITFQGHPEYPDNYLKDLYESRRGKAFDDQQCESAIKSLKMIPNDSQIVRQWIVDFLRQNIT